MSNLDILLVLRALVELARFLDEVVAGEGHSIDVRAAIDTELREAQRLRARMKELEGENDE